MEIDHAQSPPAWLVFGLEWPEDADDVAEAAYAMAPATVPRSVMPPDVVTILDFAETYARDRSVRVVFFSDLTRWLSDNGTSWAARDIDWVVAQDTIRETSILAVYLAVNRRTYTHLCDASRRRTLHHLDGSTEVLSADEREEVRSALLGVLEREWPGYVEAVVATASMDYGD